MREAVYERYPVDHSFRCGDGKAYHTWDLVITESGGDVGIAIHFRRPKIGAVESRKKSRSEI